MAISEKPWWSKDTVAVVTGSNKGIGLEIVRQLAEQGLTVVLTARDPARGRAALEKLKAEGLHNVVFHQLDVCSVESVEQLAKWLKKQFGGIDILMNNAGYLSQVFDYEISKITMDVNYYGVRNVTEGLLPVMRASLAGARIINTASRWGLFERFKGEAVKEKFRDEDSYTVEFADSMAAKYLEDVKAGKQNEKDWAWIPEHPAHEMPVSSVSKVFVTAYSIALAKSLSKTQPEDHQIFVVACCPGCVETDMLTIATEGDDFQLPPGFPVKTIPEGADTGVWLALQPKEEIAGKAGKLFADRQEKPFGFIQGDYVAMSQRADVD